MSLQIARYYTVVGEHPFDGISWEKRDVCIRGKDGQTVFEARNVEFPHFWSQRASDIVASKYFRVVRGRQEISVQDMIGRVTSAIASWGYNDGYFHNDDSVSFEDELTHILVHQYASFNSPVWFNVGVKEKPQCSACFLLAVEDNMESILDWYREEGLIFKGGSGAGINLSKIRAKGSPLSGGGTASGVLSFMKVADVNAGAIKSGGTTRRAAKMIILNADHPEIFEFIWCKIREEDKAATLRAAGYSDGMEGEALESVAFQNANNSVAVTDAFMQACSSASKEQLYPGLLSASRIFASIAGAAHGCGDPGLQFIDTINRWHTCPNSGSITTSNPCGEFVFLDNAACNLASINLLKFLKDDGSFDIPAFKHVVDIMITAQDILVDRSSYPTEKIEKVSKSFRPLGLGYSNLGAFLMAGGIPYDSDEGRNIAGAITALMTGEAYCQSSRLARVKSFFDGYTVNADAMYDVIKGHFSATELLSDVRSHAQSQSLFLAAKEAARNALDVGKAIGYRNSQVSLLAPCGTISFMMDCDTTGVEPAIALVSKKKLVGGGEIEMVNGSAERYRGTDSKVFQCALGDNALPWQAHVKMVAAVQPFLSGAVSKTINMPADSTVEDVKDAYIMAWKLGLKSIAIYRDGCKGVQPVTIEMPSKQKTKGRRNVDVPKSAVIEMFAPRRKGLPDERNSITHKFSVGGTEGYLTVGFYPSGKPGELFVTMAKEGSTLSGLMDAFASTVSLALQYGVPLEVLIAKLRHTRYEPHGFTSNEFIHTASSLTDYIAQWLEGKFISKAQITPEMLVPGSLEDFKAALRVGGPFCPDCAGNTVRNGSCWVCVDCGQTTGCS